MRLSNVVCVGAFLAVAACTSSDGVSDPGVRPQIVSPPSKDSVVVCDPKAGGGACPFTINLKFRLPEDQFVWKAYVRFQGDGSDTGVDRAYFLEALGDAGTENVPAPSRAAFGKGAGADVSVQINAEIPPAILRRGALLAYTVRLVTGAGAESSPPTPLTISVQ